MTITCIGSSCSNGTSTSFPSGTQRGDLVIDAIYRHDSAAHPTIPSGSIAVFRIIPTTSALLAVCRYLIDGSGSAQTYTNATQVGTWVLRGSTGLLIPGHRSSVSGTVGSGGTVSYPALFLASEVTNKLILAAVGHKSNDTDIATPPAAGGLSARANVQGASAGALALHDTNGNGSWGTAQTHTLTAGTSAAYGTLIFEVVETTFSLGSGLHIGGIGQTGIGAF